MKSSFNAQTPCLLCLALSTRRYQVHINFISYAWFPVSRNFFVRTCVKFTFANKIEAMHERSLVSVRVEPRSTSRFEVSTFYLASILFTWLELTCVYVRSRKREITLNKETYLQKDRWRQYSDDVTVMSKSIVFVYSAFSLTWPAAVHIYYDKRKRFYKRVQLSRDGFGTPTWSPFLMFWYSNMAHVTSCENAL